MNFYDNEETKICDYCGNIVDAEETLCPCCASCSLRPYNENEE